MFEILVVNASLEFYLFLYGGLSKFERDDMRCARTRWSLYSLFFITYFDAVVIKSEFIKMRNHICPPPKKKLCFKIRFFFLGGGQI